MSAPWLLVLAGLSSGAGAAELVPPNGPEASPPAPWRVMGLPKQTKPYTRFSVETVDGRRVLRVDSDHAYGNLVHPLKDVRPGHLSWRWRVEKPVTGADLNQRSGDDAAIKVCAMFDMPIARVPFMDRQLLRVMSSRAGEALPTATLCYVWDLSLPSGTLVRNAFTSRLRFIVVHGTPGHWTEERRDLAADFKRAFGDESSELPALSGIAVGADSDNTASRSLAWLDALSLAPPPAR